MKRIVNGNEVDIEPSGVQIDRLQDRLIVQTPEGTFSALSVRVQGKTLVSFKGRTYTVEQPGSAAATGAAGSGDLTAPMPGLIFDVLVEAGEAVIKGQKLLVLEAMKTQQPMLAPFDGVVEKVHVSKGSLVDGGQALVSVREP